MTRLAIVIFLSVNFFVFGLVAGAAAVDLVPYMALKPGKWAVWQELGKSSRAGYVTESGANGEIVRKWYDDEGNGWVFGSSEIFQITSTTLSFVGMHDGTDLWLLDPRLKIQRQINLNQPVFYTGNLKNQRTSATQPITQVFMITASGLKANTQARTFRNCIKIKSYQHSAGVSRVSTSLMAVGRAEVKGWVSKIKDTANPQQEIQNAFSTQIVQFGDSNPPLP